MWKHKKYHNGPAYTTSPKFIEDMDILELPYLGFPAPILYKIAVSTVFVIIYMMFIYVP